MSEPRKNGRPKTRPPGRPKTRPADAKKRSWYATDVEFAKVKRAAAKEGMSAEEYVRGRVLSRPAS